MSEKSEIISFWNSTHEIIGKSASASASEFRKKGNPPIDSAVVFGVYPNCLHCEFNTQFMNVNSIVWIFR